MVAARIAAGAGLVTFSGDKLLGGPQAGLIVGRRDLVERLKANPLRRALRCDKLTLAALAATLRLYLRSPDLGADLPTLRLLRRTPAELESVAKRAREILAERLGADFTIEVVVSASEIGSGALPAEEIESRALRITHREHSPDAIAADVSPRATAGDRADYGRGLSSRSAHGRGSGCVGGGPSD